MRIIILLSLIFTTLSASAIDIKIKGLTPIEEGLLKKYYTRRIGKLVVLNFTNEPIGNYVFIRMFDDYPAGKCGETVAVSSVDITVEQIHLNRYCIEGYGDAALIAFLNSALHEVVCHALVENGSHTKRGLCRGGLRTHRLEWSKFDRENFKRKLRL